MPLLYGVVALSYAGRYWRWRLLLGRLGIGSTNWPDLLGWFRGFALTATPAKVGELSRVQLLHEQLGYPRLPWCMPSWLSAALTWLPWRCCYWCSPQLKC